MPNHILIVDDEPAILDTLSSILQDESYEVSVARGGQEALKFIKADSPPDLVLLDIWMPDLDGIETLQRAMEAHPRLLVIMMSGHGSIESAVKAIKLGAYDYIEKPLSLEKVTLLVRHALHERRLELENRDLRERAGRQAKVLRVLQEQRFQRVGGTRPINVDVRVIAASNKNLVDAIRKGTFRDDLYFRLAVLQIDVPPLRERREDIPALVYHFMQINMEEQGLRPREFSEEAMDVLQRHDWPGNVRELRNLVERVVIMARGPVIQTTDVAPLVRQSGEGHPPEVPSAFDYASLRDARAAFEREYIGRKLREHGWNVSKTADDLKVERSHLHRKIKLLNIEVRPES